MVALLFLTSVISIEWKLLGEWDSLSPRQDLDHSFVQIPGFVAVEAEVQ